jgi:hypothetical protein
LKTAPMELNSSFKKYITSSLPDVFGQCPARYTKTVSLVQKTITAPVLLKNHSPDTQPPARIRATIF